LEMHRAIGLHGHFREDPLDAFLLSPRVQLTVSDRIAARARTRIAESMGTGLIRLMPT
jgi:hypothetical protein